MPIVHIADSYEQAVKSGINVHLYRGGSQYLNGTLQFWQNGEVSSNLNPSISLDEQPRNLHGSNYHHGYEYTPILWLYETHHGICIREYERNGYNDSDFFMLVWDAETQQPKSIEFASTRGWSYPCYASTPDASPEILAAYSEWKREQRIKAEKEAEEYRALQPAKGKTLRVVRGRKVKIGTVGLCIWLGDGSFGKRVGIKDAAGIVYWTAASNVEVVRS